MSKPGRGSERLKLPQGGSSTAPPRAAAGVATPAAETVPTTTETPVAPATPVVAPDATCATCTHWVASGVRHPVYDGTMDANGDLVCTSLVEVGHCRRYPPSAGVRSRVVNGRYVVGDLFMFPLTLATDGCGEYQLR